MDYKWGCPMTYLITRTYTGYTGIPRDIELQVDHWFQNSWVLWIIIYGNPQLEMPKTWLLLTCHLRARFHIFKHTQCWYGTWYSFGRHILCNVVSTPETQGALIKGGLNFEPVPDFVESFAICLERKEPLMHFWSAFWDFTRSWPENVAK